MIYDRTVGQWNFWKVAFHKVVKWHGFAVVGHLIVKFTAEDILQIGQ